MNCRKLEKLFIFFLENKLKPRDRKKVEKHFEQCQNCSKLFEELKGIVEFLKTIKVKELPANFYEDTELKLDGAQTVLQTRKHSFIIPRVYIPAICVLLLATGIMLWKTKENAQIISYVEKVATNLSEQEGPISDKKKGVSKKSKKQEYLLQSSEEKPEETTQVKKDEITKKIIEIAKLSSEEKVSTILRGTDFNYKKKRIIKQWQDTYSGIKTKETLIIRTRKELQELWKKHTQNMNPTPSIPEIDFNSSIIIAVFMGEKKTGGYGIHISQIEESLNNIYIELEETVPSTGIIVTQSFTQPYHILVVNKD